MVSHWHVYDTLRKQCFYCVEIPKNPSSAPLHNKKVRPSLIGLRFPVVKVGCLCWRATVDKRVCISEVQAVPKCYLFGWFIGNRKLRGNKKLSFPWVFGHLGPVGYLDSWFQCPPPHTVSHNYGHQRDKHRSFTIKVRLWTSVNN